MTAIKVCGVTSLEDAVAAVEAGADALGFNLYPPSPRYVSTAAARSIIEALPAGVTTVGVFVNAGTPEEVSRAADAAGFDFVQLHGDETPEYCERVGCARVIKALRVGPRFEAAGAAGYSTGAVLLDAYVAGERGGTGHTFDWNVARRVREIVPCLYLAGGLNPANVAEAVRAVAPFAVDVCSGVERAPGRKDAALMRRFVESVRGAEGRA
ncbi:MAG TPA: phosphoribosylanthranilate isomerase [Pyrinomonadaceae bacterium]|nr:phosphoribosylanthranilate isomerase [Pyrinomonadaceae bacterium]